MADRRKPDYWLVRTGTIRGMWVAFVLVLILSVLAGLLVETDGEFGIDGSFGFYAWFGFLSCVVLIVGARILGAILKRKENYYGG